MQYTAVFEPSEEGGYTCFVQELPAAISQGETLAQAKANLIDALKLVIESNRAMARERMSENAIREPIEPIELAEG